MTGRWVAWWRLMPVWAPVVVLCVVNVGVYLWLSSDSLGREAQLRSEIEELQQDVARLERDEARAGEERQGVTLLNADLEHLYLSKFSSLDKRLTSIMREVGRATRDAGLLVGKYSYTAGSVPNMELVRFGVRFSVNGRYDQIRGLLENLATSDEFLLVDRISFSGDEYATTNELDISILVETFLTEADSELLEELTRGDKSSGAADE